MSGCNNQEDERYAYSNFRYFENDTLMLDENLNECRLLIHKETVYRGSHDVNEKSKTITVVREGHKDREINLLGLGKQFEAMLDYLKEIGMQSHTLT